MRDRHFNRYRDSGQFSEERMIKFRERRRQNRMFFGIAMAFVGIIMLLKSMGVIPYYMLRFHTSWPFLFLIIGLFLGIRSKFSNNSWWVFLVIGIANLTPQFMINGQPSTHFVWPALIIVFGLVIAFRPRKEKCYPGKRMTSSINTESIINIESTFGGRKEVITSKDFKGGAVSITFAGCELNLTQADFTEPSIVIDCRVSFGGLEIIVPSHWEVQNEVNPSFGSVEDSRTIQTGTASDIKKILILRGSCSFGSIELKSY